MKAYEILPENPSLKVPNNNIIVFEFEDGRKIFVNVPDNRKEILQVYAQQNHHTLTPETLEIFLQSIKIIPK